MNYSFNIPNTTWNFFPRRVDTEHPVYALLAHCVAVQTAFQTVNVGINLGRSIDLGLAFGKIVHFSAILLTVILRLFYETTWALVTYLRFSHNGIHEFKAISKLTTYFEQVLFHC